MKSLLTLILAFTILPSPMAEERLNLSLPPNYEYDWECSECSLTNSDVFKKPMFQETKPSFGRELAEIVQVGVLAEITAGQFREKDKQMHARAGAYVGYFSKKACEKGPEILELDLRIGPVGQFFCALAGAAVAGVLKEVYDSTDRQNHTVDSRDALATAIGGFANIPLYRIEFKF